MTEDTPRPEDTCLIGFMRGILADDEEGEDVDEELFRVLLAAIKSVLALIDAGQKPAGVLMSQADHNTLTAVLGSGPFSVAGRDVVFQVSDIPEPTAYAQSG